eukprot:m.155498 g.155498  ORF g.155498 m.155498 type:complete len:135 (+) comp14409_c0_seq3:18-422(+)
MEVSACSVLVEDQLVAGASTEGKLACRSSTQLVAPPDVAAMLKVVNQTVYSGTTILENSNSTRVGGLQVNGGLRVAIESYSQDALTVVATQLYRCTTLGPTLAILPENGTATSCSLMASVVLCTCPATQHLFPR